MSETSAPLLHFLIELRKRLLFCLLIVLMIFLPLLYFSNDLYTTLAQPLLQYLPKQQSLIATQMTSPFFVPFELAFLVALFLSMPLCLYQAWAFVAPALYRHEKRLIWPFFFISVFLFYSGAMFAYGMVLPMLFKFLTHSVPSGVIMMPDMKHYFDFTWKCIFMFGIFFELPMVLVVLVRTSIVKCSTLVRLRPYAIIGSFILGMLFAPPDIFSQTVVALPLWALYEIGIIFSTLLNRK